MAKDIDPQNMSADDVQYVQDRPWLAQEFEINGIELSSLESTSPESSDGDGDGEDDGSSSYEDWDYQDLRKEVASRELEADSNSKEDLIAALVADDADDE